MSRQISPNGNITITVQWISPNGYIAMKSQQISPNDYITTKSQQISPNDYEDKLINMKITSTKEIGAAIRDKRKKLGYTQAHLAAHTGFSTSFISDLENGKATTELGKALFMLQLLGMDVDLKDRGT